MITRSHQKWNQFIIQDHTSNKASNDNEYEIDSFVASSDEKSDASDGDVFGVVKLRCNRGGLLFEIERGNRCLVFGIELPAVPGFDQLVLLWPNGLSLHPVINSGSRGPNGFQRAITS